MECNRQLVRGAFRKRVMRGGGETHEVPKSDYNAKGNTQGNQSKQQSEEEES